MRVLALRCGCAAPTGLNKCVPMINPGLAPWALNKYRPKGLIARMGVSLKIRMVYAVEFGIVYVVRYEWCASLKFEWVCC